MQPLMEMGQAILAAQAGLGPVRAALSAGRGAVVYGLHEGQKPWLLAHLAPDRPALVITEGEDKADAWARDLEALLGKKVFRMPARTVLPYRVEAEDRRIVGMRVAALEALMAGEVVVASVEAAQAALCPPQVLADARIQLTVGDTCPPEELAKRLYDAGYARVDQVESAGQFAHRGGILDCMDALGGQGVRIEFFDDEIDSIRAFDPATQRTIRMLDSALLPAACECPAGEEVRRDALLRVHAALAAFGRRSKREESKESKKQTRPLMPWEDEDEQPQEAGPGLGDKAAGLIRAAGRADDPLEGARARVEALEQALAQGVGGAELEAWLPFFYPACASVADYVPAGGYILLDEPFSLRQKANNLMALYTEMMAMALQNGAALPRQQELLWPCDDLLARLQKTGWLAMMTLPRNMPEIRPDAVYSVQAQPMLSYFGRLDALCADLAAWKKRGIASALLCGSQQKAERLAQELRERGVEAWAGVPGRAIREGETIALPLALEQGFLCDDWRLAVLCPGELYGREAPDKARKKAPRRRSAAENKRVFADLAPGDYVVHETYGIGRFVQMTCEQAVGVSREYMVIEYQGSDRLYVPTEQLDRVQRYIGNDDSPPRISRMGGKDWERAKGKARAAVQKTAEGLVELYAKRQQAKGFAFSPDTPWQREFEGQFPYEETPDQLQSIEEIKHDMESGRPMDRLLCGDVGYGKTEVALRAAFKAVQDNRQVAILVPTTLLAQQHFLTLSQRMEGFPVTCEMLSRFRTPAQQREILAKLKDGTLDIVVGTHRLLGQDVVFKRLGLLIVDEEQRFGVNHKERIKRMKENVDVLTLTATPIPRTLHMSMVGIRDLSVIDTPPQDRYPVQTMVLEYREGLIKEAIQREIGRGGQVYFLFNRVRGIERMADHLRALVPGLRVLVGHGQMEQHQLEEVMLAFMRHEADVLLCTTIIENGIDIPLANTIIAFDADHLGLAQLYQLRGRVGRSNRLAYAYLTYRPGKMLSETASKRLQAIRDFTRLGSGFRIAMRDLEIRGAGNLLGAEQHGHIAAVGYDLYCRLIEQELQRLQGKEGAVSLGECRVELPIDAYLPEHYVGDERRRLALYRRLADIDSLEGRSEAIDEMIDRYGEAPDCAIRLADIAYARTLARRIGVADISSPRAGEVALRFYDAANFEPERLLAALETMPDAKLMPGSGARVVLRRKGATAEQLLGVATRFLETMQPEKCEQCENSPA
nr:transcription-repair coupling factor [bacterium]